MTIDEMRIQLEVYKAQVEAYDVMVAAAKVRMDIHMATVKAQAEALQPRWRVVEDAALSDVERNEMMISGQWQRVPINGRNFDDTEGVTVAWRTRVQPE